MVFEMSTIFLAIRNFATCFLLGMEKVGNFSRRSALQMGKKSIQISLDTFDLLERSRILSIRGTGKMIETEKIISSLEEISSIKIWMNGLLAEVNTNG